MLRLPWASVLGGLILLITVYLISHTYDDVYQTSLLTAGRGPVFFPRIVLAAMAVFSLVVILQGMAEQRTTLPWRHLLPIAATVAATGAYIAAIDVAGFLIATVVYTATLPWLLGYRRPLPVLLVALLYPVIVWFVFEKVFLIILPSSPWFEMF